MADITGYLKIISEANSGESVRDAIINCMRTINDDAAIKCTSLVITSADNITYKPGTGKAFRSVTVNIDGSGSSDPESTKTYEQLEITEATENQTFPPEGHEGVAYNKVVVNIDWESVLSHSDDFEEESHMTIIETDPTTGKKFWDPVMWRGKKYTARVWIDTDTGLPDYPGGGGGGTPGAPCNINFYRKDTGDLIESTVGTYGTPLSYSFTSEWAKNNSVIWSPDPFMGVTSNPMNCYGEVSTSVYSKGDTTSDSWEVICANKGGSKYGIGTIKNLILTGLPYDTHHGDGWIHEATLRSKTYNRTGGTPTSPATCTYPAKDVIGKTFKMIKIADGAEGTTSTWMCFLSKTLPSSLYPDLGDPFPLVAWQQYTQGGITNDEMDYYPTSYIHQFLNLCLLPAFPKCLRDSIRSVGTKTAMAQASNIMSEQRFSEPTEMQIGTWNGASCRLWIPSIGEWKGDPTLSHDEWKESAMAASFGVYDDIYESKGHDYGSHAVKGGFSMADIYNMLVDAGETNAAIPFFRTMIFSRNSNDGGFIGIIPDTNKGYMVPAKIGASPNGILWGDFQYRLPICFCL